MTGKGSMWRNDLTIGEFISNWREAKNLQYSEVALAVSVSTEKMMRWDIGEEIPNDFELKSLSDALGISFLVVKKIQALRRPFPAQPDFPADVFVLIRQVNGKISAGGGLMPDYSADLLCAFRREWIKRKGGKPDNMSLIKVDGDSMAPTLLPGDLVLVDHGRNSIASQGGIYAISIDDEIMIKRVQPSYPDKILVISDNKQYPIRELATANVRVNGKVIWYARDLERS